MLNTLAELRLSYGESFFAHHGNIAGALEVGPDSVPEGWNLARKRYLRRCVELFGRRLATAGIASLSLEEARTAPGAARLRLRLVANKDAYGFYYFKMRADVRQKVPLGNPAGGFVSQVVWSDGESGTMQYNEHEKPLSAIDRLLDALIADLKAQNSR